MHAHAVSTWRDGCQGRAQHDGVPGVHAVRAAVQVTRRRSLQRQEVMCCSGCYYAIGFSHVCWVLFYKKRIHGLRA